MADEHPTRTIAPLFTWRTAIAESDMTPVVRHVLLTLSLYMNERGGSAYPGSARLSHDTGLHPTTVKRSLGDAVRNGYLEIVTKGGSPTGGKRLANEYAAATPDRVWTDRGQKTTGSAEYVDRGSTARGPVAEGDPISSLITSENSRGSASNAPKNCVRCHGAGSFWDGQKQRTCDHVFAADDAAPPPWVTGGTSRDEWMRAQESV